MSAPFTRFGAFIGLAGGDVRVQIGGKGRKNVLAVTASYRPSTLVAPAASFQGRLVIVEGQLDPLPQGTTPVPLPPDFAVAATFAGLKILFNAFLTSVGPHPFFLPLAQLEGSPQTDEDNIVNIVLTIGSDGAGGTYIPSLSVSGQTVFGGTLAAQSNFLGSATP